MARTYTFRISAEGVEQFKAQMKSLGGEGAAALKAVEAAMPGLGAALDAAEQKMVQAREKSAAQLAASARRLKDALDPIAAAERENAKAEAEYLAMRQAGLITEEQRVAAVRRSNTVLAEAKGALVGVAQASRLSFTEQEILRSGIINTVQSVAGGIPVMKALETQIFQMAPAFPALARAMGPVGLAVAGVGVAVAALAAPLAIGIIRSIEMSGQARELGVAIRGMGRDAEISSGQLAGTVEQLRRLHVAADDANAVALASVRNPGLSAARGQQLAALVPDFAAGTGAASAAAAMDQLVEAFSQGYDAVERLDQRFNFLTRSELQQIRTMASHGDQAKALDVAVDALQRRFGGLHDASMSDSAKAVAELSNAWRDFTDTLARSEVVSYVVTKIGDALKYYVEAAKDARAAGNPLVQMTDLQSAIAGEEKRLAYMQANPTQFAPQQLTDLQARIDGMRRQVETLRDEGRRLGTGISGSGRGVRVYDEAIGPTGAQPEDPRLKVVDRYIEGLERETAALQGSEAARIQARVAIEAEAYARTNGLGPAEKERVEKALLAKAMAEATDGLIKEGRASDRAVVSSLALANAWEHGRDQAEQVSAAMQAHEMWATKVGVAEDVWRQRILDRAAAEAAADLAKSNGQLAERVAAMESLVAAEAKGAEAVDKAEVAEKKRAATVDARAKLANTSDPKILAALNGQIDRTEKLLDAEAKLAAERKANAAIRQRQQDIELARLDQGIALEVDPRRRADLERSTAIRREELRLMDQYPGRQEQINTLLRQYIELYDIQAVTRFYDQVGEQAKAMAGDMRSFVVDAFTSIDQEGGSIFRGLFDGIVKTAKRAAANVVAAFLEQQVFIPVSMAVVGSMPGMFGISAPAGVSGMPAMAANNWVSQMMPSPTSFLPDGFMTPWSNNFMGIAGGIQNIFTPGAGWLGSAFPSVFGAGFAPVLGLEAGAASMGAAGLGLTAAEATTLGAGMAPGALAGASGFLSVAGPIAIAAVAAILASGMFGDKQDPRGNAQFGAFVDGHFTTNVNRTAPDTALDGYDVGPDAQNRDRAVGVANSIIDALGLKLDNSTLSAAFTAPSGLGGIGSMYGWAKNADEWLLRLFSWNTKSNAIGGSAGQPADVSEGTFQRQRGYNVSYDRDNGYSYTDSEGRVVDVATYQQQYEDWAKAQTATPATPGQAGSSLFDAQGNKSLQKALDRLSTGELKVSTVEGLTEKLNYAATFDRNNLLATAGGPGTRQGQGLAWRFAAEDSAKATAQAYTDYVKNADEIYGAGSDEAKAARANVKQQALTALGLGPEGGGKAMTGLAATLGQINASVDAAKPALKAAGFTDAEAEAKMRAGRTKLIGDTIDDQLRQLKDPEGYARGELNKQIAGITEEAAKTGDASVIAKAAELTAKMRDDFEKMAAETAAMKEETKQRAKDSMADRADAAKVTLGQKDRDAAERDAMVRRQRQEMFDAQHNEAWTDEMRIQLQHTQQLEAEALAYTQAVNAMQEAAQKAAPGELARQSVAVARVQQTLLEATTYLDGFGRRVDKVAEAEQRLSDVRSRGLQLVNGYRQAEEALGKTLTDIRLGAQSALSPAEQLEVARRAYLTARAGATGAATDEDRQKAMADLGPAAQRYLELLKSTTGSSAEYVNAFNDVTGELERVRGYARDQKDYLSDQLKLMDKYFPSIDAGVIDIAAAVNGYVSARSAANKATGTANSSLAGQFDALAAAVDTFAAGKRAAGMRDDDVATAVETQFGASRNAIIQAITDPATLNSLLQKYYSTIPYSEGAVALRTRIIQLGGIPAFAAGGLHYGGLRLVGERGPELEISGPARYLSTEQTMAVLSPGNDNSIAGRRTAFASGATVDLSPVVEAVAGLGPAFRSAMLPAERLLARLVAENEAMRREIAGLRQDWREGRSRTNPDTFGRGAA